MKPLLFALIGLAALASVAAGCGGGESRPLTKQEFTAKADEICQRANLQFAQVTTDLQTKIAADPGQSRGAVESSLRQIAPLVKDTVNEIGELKPPAELQAKLDTYVREANGAADQVAADPAKYAEKSTSSAGPFPQLASLSKELGLGNCGPG